MRSYLNLLRDIMTKGTLRSDRTGVGTLPVFGRQLRFDLAEGFPLLTTKRLPFRHIAEELFWFISGSTNANDLEAKGVTIWREWADPDTGELGPVYGAMWRRWPITHKIYPTTETGFGFGASEPLVTESHIDQLAATIQSIRTDPHSRRHVVSAWNVGELHKMALPPCHLLYQFDVTNGSLSCQMYQRSADVFLGLPFNIASYALLTHLVAAQTGLVPGELIITLGDAHLYTNHIDQARLQLTREPRPLPKLTVAEGVPDIDSYRFEHLTLEAYNPHPHIPAPVAV